jgi:hypothetical protein
VGKFEGLKGHKAQQGSDILHFGRAENLAQMPDGKNIETPSAALGYVFIRGISRGTGGARGLR